MIIDLHHANMEREDNTMAENKQSEIIKTALESIKTILDANTVIGTPISTPAGTTIIPVSKITVGYASGGLDYLKKNKIKTVISLHAELMHTAGCDHAYDCEKWKTQCCDCPRIKGYISKYFPIKSIILGKFPRQPVLRCVWQKPCFPLWSADTAINA